MITIDREFEIRRYSPVCLHCKHFIDFRACKAFPEKIPLEIWNGENTHTEPYEGDHGIQFEQYEATEK